MNRDIGKIRKDLKSKNCEEVYEAIYHLNRQVKLHEIMEYLDKQTKIKNIATVLKASEKLKTGQYRSEIEMKKDIRNNLRHTISEKTVQRCISGDPRIEDDRRKYSITQKVRLESRYLFPGDFGLGMLHHIIGKVHRPGTLEEDIKHFVMRFGAYIFYNFIEAVRPFQDDSLTVWQKEELVLYWARTAIPLDNMFQLFLATFDGRTHQERAKHVWKTPFSEVKQDRIKELLAAMQKVFPEIYHDLDRARNQEFSKV